MGTGTFLGDQLCNVILGFLSSLKDHMLLVRSLHVRLQINEVILLSLDECNGLLALLLQLVLRYHEIPFELIEACIVHIAHFHLRERGQLTHVVCIITRSMLLKNGKVDLLSDQELPFDVPRPIFAVNELNF